MTKWNTDRCDFAYLQNVKSNTHFRNMCVRFSVWHLQLIKKGHLGFESAFVTQMWSCLSWQLDEFYWQQQVFLNCMSDPEYITPSCSVEDYLSSELLVFFELRVRYLQACERIQEAKALSKSCLEYCEAGKHLYFRQAYLTCLYKGSLHEHLHKEVKWQRLIWKSLKRDNGKQVEIAFCWSKPF